MTRFAFRHVQVTPTQRQYYKELEKAFKRQKFHSVETALREHQLVGVKTQLFQIPRGGLGRATPRRDLGRCGREATCS